MGRPHQLSIIDTSEEEKGKIANLKKLRSFCKRSKTDPPNFSRYDYVRLESAFNMLFKETDISEEKIKIHNRNPMPKVPLDGF